MKSIILYSISYIGDGENHCSSSLETNWQDSGLKNTINHDSYKIALTSLTARYSARAGVRALS